MDRILQEFKGFFDNEDKENAVKYIISKLQSKEVDVIQLYSKILTPLLNNIQCDLKDKKICIWKEHV